MVRIKIRHPGSDAPLVEDLAPGEAVLLGRAPDATRLAPSSVQPPGARVRAVSVGAPSVSGSHLVVGYDGARLFVEDLGSRNGSWIELPGRTPVAFDAPGALSLELSPTAQRKEAAKPRPVECADPEELPDAVAAEVTRWFRAMGLSVTAQALPQSAARAAQSSHALPPMPLGDEWVLVVSEAGSARTVDPLWGETIPTLLEYVHEQGAAMGAMRAHEGHVVLAAPAMRDAHRRVAEAAERGLQVILLGETGAGKGTMARCYHLHSARHARPFETVNCAEIDKHFAHTRLFGAKKGAYTGCTSDVAGAVECAHGGTLFLDELAELPLDVQAMLLSFLDTRKYKRMGDDEWRAADVRIVCGTHADLRRSVRDGRFRADLWYRLAGRTVEVPPLRERREDIAAFLRRAPLGERGDAVTAWDALTPEARELVTQRYDWRGNFRELEGFVRRLPADARAASLDVEACRAALAEGALEPPSYSKPPAAPGDDPWQGLLARASEVYRARSGVASPARTGDFKEYVEDVLKPMFFARALGMEHLDALPERPTPSFEELARRLGCDGATVKSQLARFVELKRAHLK